MDYLEEQKNYLEYLSGLRKVSSLYYYVNEEMELKELYSRSNKDFKEFLYDEEFCNKYLCCIEEICSVFIDTYNYICNNHRFNIEDFNDLIQIVKSLKLNYFLSPSEFYSILQNRCTYWSVDIIKHLKTDWKTINTLITLYKTKEADQFIDLLNNIDYRDIGIYLELQIRSENVYCSLHRSEAFLYERSMQLRLIDHKGKFERLLKVFIQNKDFIKKNFGEQVFDKYYLFINKRLGLIDELLKSIEDDADLMRIVEDGLDRHVNVSLNLLDGHNIQRLINNYSLLRCYCELFSINLSSCINEDERDVVNRLLGWGFFNSIYGQEETRLESSSGEQVNNMLTYNIEKKEILLKIEPILKKAISNGLIVVSDGGYKKTDKLTKADLAYLCGKIICNDYIEKPEDERMPLLWRKGVNNLNFPDKILSDLFQESQLGVSRRTRLNKTPPEAWKLIDSMFE